MTQENVFLHSQIIASLGCIFVGIVLCLKFNQTERGKIILWFSCSPDRAGMALNWSYEPKVWGTDLFINSST